jgi:hypothetical protein
MFYKHKTRLFQLVFNWQMQAKVLINSIIPQLILEEVYISTIKKCKFLEINIRFRILNNKTNNIVWLLKVKEKSLTLIEKIQTYLKCSKNFLILNRVNFQQKKRMKKINLMEMKTMKVKQLQLICTKLKLIHTQLLRITQLKNFIRRRMKMMKTRWIIVQKLRVL